MAKNLFTEAQLNEKSVGELVKIYNSFVPADAQVKRFADKKSAVRRTLQASQKTLVKANAAAKQKNDGEKALTEAGKELVRSVAVTQTWNDPLVREMRSARIEVTANGETFKSVPDAFRHFGIPVNKAIAFRGKLRAAGRLTYNHEGTDIKFRVTATRSGA